MVMSRVKCKFHLGQRWSSTQSGKGGRVKVQMFKQKQKYYRDNIAAGLTGRLAML